MPDPDLNVTGEEQHQAQTKTNYFPKLPKHELEALARCLFPSISAYFETEEGQKAFAEWEKKHQPQ